VARTLARAGRLDQSLVEYMETMRSRPGLSHIVADEVVGLSPDFERARVLARLPEDRVPAWEALAGAYLRAGYAEQARRADVATLGIDPLAPGPLARAVRRHMDAGLWDDARKLARRLATVPDYEARALALQGEIEHRTGNPTGALALYEMAFELNQSFRPVLLKVADLHFERGERKQMFDALELYQATSPTEEARGQALLVRASYEMKLGLTNQALFSYREASSSLPDDPGLWKAIARICEHLHEPAAALEAYRELARIEPENPDWQEKLEAAMAEATSKVLLEKE
jgi:tetratricopeptide (TPR) repeat protein